MWLTCNDALNRYDGKTVKVYNLDKYFDKCPNLQQGYGFTEDNEGNIYIGSVRGLYFYNRKKDTFSLQKIFINKTDEIAMPIGYRDGKVWCFNKQFQLATFDIKTKKVTLVTKLKLKPLKSIHIYEMSDNIFYFHYPFIDNQGKLWLITDDQITSFDPKTNKSEYPLLTLFEKQNATIFSSCYDSSSNSIFLGTKKGLFQYNLTDNKFSEIKNKGKGFVLILCVAVSQKMLAFRTEYEVFFQNRNTKEVINLSVNATNNYNRTFGYTFDKSGRFWCGDDGKGQLIFNFNNKLLPKIPDETTTFNYFNLSGVTRFAQLSENEIVIPNIIQQKSILVVFDLKTKKMTDIPFEYRNLGSLGNYACVSDPKRKGIWFFTQKRKGKDLLLNISFLNQEKKISNYTLENSLSEKGDIQDIQILPNGKLMCAFTNGLYWLNPEKRILKKIETAIQSNFFKINILDQNYIAVSCINSDMALYQLQKDNSLKFVRSILPKIQSFYMQKDTNRDRYWIGTNQGLYLLDKNFEITNKFDANAGLAGTYIYGLLLDNDGNIFCSHQRGLSSIYAYTFQITNYDKSDGIQDWDFNNRAYYKALDGTLFFGGVSGFNYFKPPVIPVSYYKPEVYIDAILVNSKALLLGVNPNYIQKLNLNYNQNNITIKALVKDLANANGSQLIYKIKDVDKKSNRLANGATINFNNLAPNEYTVQFGYYDKFANKEVYQKMMFIVISAPFYYKVWFWSLIGFAVASFGFWLYNKRKFDKQQRAFQQQLALEQQRSKITADLHDEIGSSLSSLQINSSVASFLVENNPAEAQKILAKIEEQSEHLSDKIGDIIWSMKPGKEEFLTLTSRIKNFANDILGATDINYKINIDKKIDIIITDISTRKNIVLFIKEAINNAAKYSKAESLLVSLSVFENQVIIEISDNGIGFDSNLTKGNGLGNMQKRVEELKGQFLITSKKNLGTTIKATFSIVP